MITGLLKRQCSSHFCPFSEWWHTRKLHLFLFIDTGRRINVSLHKKCPKSPPFWWSYCIMIINTYLKFDDVEWILGKISKREEGCQTNRHYEAIYRHLGKKILGTFYSNGYTELRNNKIVSSKQCVQNLTFQIGAKELCVWVTEGGEQLKEN